MAAAPRSLHRMRADATRNRERILAAAREVYVEHGPDAPLDEIARRAGVANATLYRHFEDRNKLAHDVALSAVDRITAHAEDALLDESDAFEALRTFVYRAAEERVGSLCTMLSGTFDLTVPEVVEGRARLEHAIGELMARARASGQLRRDVDIGDLLAAVTQLTRPLPGAECGGFERFVARHLQIFVDGLRTPSRSTLPGAAATLEDLRSHLG